MYLLFIWNQKLFGVFFQVTDLELGSAFSPIPAHEYLKAENNAETLIHVRMDIIHHQFHLQINAFSPPKRKDAFPG